MLWLYRSVPLVLHGGSGLSAVSYAHLDVYKRQVYGEILHAGLPSFCRQGLASVAAVVLNFAAGPYGDAAIAAMSIVTRFMMFINSSLIGFGQGFQPVCGFNFGAKRYDRVLEAYWFCVKVAVACLLYTSRCV